MFEQLKRPVVGGAEAPAKAPGPLRAVRGPGGIVVSRERRPLPREATARPEDQAEHEASGEVYAPDVVGETLRSGGGHPLDGGTREQMEARFGHDFAGVRVHTGERAAASAEAIGALAYTAGRDVVFGAGGYAPGTADGRRLLAHELSHVVQQKGAAIPSSPIPVAPADAPAEAEADTMARAALSRPSAPVPRSSPAGGAPLAGGGPARAARAVSGTAQVMRQRPTGQRPAGAATTPVTATDTAELAVTYLHDMADFIAAQRQAMARAPAGRVVVDQSRVAAYLHQAQTTYEAQRGGLPANSSVAVSLRTSYVEALNQIRLEARDAVIASDARGGAARNSERALYAENMAKWIEASPMTSAGLSGTTTFTAADVTQGQGYVAALEAYLDDLLAQHPGSTLSQPQRDAIFDRVNVALRRAFVTVSAGPGGAIDVSAISNARIVDKYQRVIDMLHASSRPQMSIITDTIALSAPPDPVPDRTAQITSAGTIHGVDTSHVPAAEVASVRFALSQIARVTFPAQSTVTLRNAYWPLVVPIRVGGAGANVIQVRYEFAFDASSNVRAERLGAAQARQVAPAFAALSVADKIASLVHDFGLAAIVGRPAVHGGRGVHARPAVSWTGPELDEVKAVYDLLPAADRAALRGVTLVRDSSGPAPPGASILSGFAHTGADAAHDQPGPPTHGPPHIHYYDAAFATSAITAVGAPGDTGPGADETLAHEVGHMRVNQATLAANASIDSANAALNAADPALRAAIRGVRLAAPERTAFRAWSTASTAANAAIVAVGGGGSAAAARTAVAARDTARAGLVTAGLPAGIIARAAALDAANDALLAAGVQQVAARDQIPAFVAVANHFGFHRFTDYARRGGDAEWYAETFALYVNDPNRLREMNRDVYLWFKTGRLDRSVLSTP